MCLAQLTTFLLWVASALFHLLESQNTIISGLRSSEEQHAIGKETQKTPVLALFHWPTHDACMPFNDNSTF